MVIQHNLSAANASRSFHIITDLQAKNSEKLSSGYRINRAADDAAGLTISEKMRGMIRGLNRASKNAQDGYSLLQVADGALGEVQALLQRARELSVQAATDTNTDCDRGDIQAEIDELVVEINRIADTTEFNTLKLLDGSLSGSASNIAVSASASANSLVASTGMQSVNGGIVKNPIVAGSAAGIMTQARTANLENDLNNIVPRSVGAIMNTFRTSFGASGSIANSIGVEFYADSSSTLAFVACRYGYTSAGQISGIELNLSVNVNHLQFDANNQLTADSRASLEATIAHEMVHAFMDNDLTNGMLGATNGVIDKSNQFPGWFKEGMAQCASGGSSPYNNWVGGGLGLNAGSSAAQITAAVQSSANSLSSGTTASKYGTGYLACMYLGYLADGSNTVSASAIGSGLDKILARMARNGDTLNDIIKDISGGKYTSASDFQRKFGDASSVAFISDLLNQTGNNGSGSVIAAGGLNAADVLTGAASNSNKYRPDFTNAYVTSQGNFQSGGSGGYSGSGKLLWLQVGALGGQGIGISIDDAHTMALGIDSLSVKNFEEAGQAIDAIDHALEAVSANRSSIGAYMNRLEHTIANLDNTAENTQAAESRIRDTDMAEEMVSYSKNNILAQTGQAMLAQANQSTQAILSILQS